MKKNNQPKPFRHLLTTCLLIVPLTVTLSAQTPTSLEVKGQITDGTSPIPGATVLIKGEQRGTVSDFNGRYNINAQPADTLVISYIGYATVEEPVNNRTTINFVMQEDATSLREVVINAGYYSVKDRERTGSIARITSEEIEIQPVNNPLEALQGRIPGVDIVQTSGVSGSGFEVRIRGQNSIMAGNAPLYVIDGVPYDSGTLSNSNVSVQIMPLGNVSPLNAINPATIESVEILKDADATAIYGSRGANGVVLITTKKGKAGKTIFTVGSSTGKGTIAHRAKLMNTNQYLEMRREAFANDGITDYPFNAYDINGTWDQNRYTDWQKVLIGGTASTNQVQGSISGGNENTRFLLSGMFQDETTVFPGNFDYERINVNSNIQHSGNDQRFKVLFNVAYNLENNNLPMNDLTFDALVLPPNAPALYQENGEINWENSTWTNPLAKLQAPYTSKINGLLSNAVLSYLPILDLETKLNLGYGNNRIDERYISPHTVFDPAFGLNSSISQLFINRGHNTHWILEPQVEWKRSIQKNKLSILVGSTFQKRKNQQEAFVGVGFSNNSFINSLSAANTSIVLNENETIYTYNSFYGRVNYTIRDKVFLNATGRRDGSSRFGPGNRYGNFGAVGAAWIFSEDLKLDWLNFGKLRGSYGITGNDQIGDYQYLQTYIVSDFPYEGNIGLDPARLYNPDFKWEENKKAEAALELKFLDHRLSFTAAYYNNRSSNQLIRYSLPATTGFTSIQANLDALVENSGWEFEVNGDILRDGGFTWGSSFNISLAKNTLLKFPGLENSTYANRFEIGESLSIIKLYKFNGVNPDSGLFEFEDYNGDGLLTAIEDRQYIVDRAPKLFGGFSNTLRYKNWGMDIFFQFVKKKGFNQFYSSRMPGRMFNQPVDVLDRWQKPGDISPLQQYSSGGNSEATLAYSQFSQSSAAVTDASFIRLKSAALSYTLPLDKNQSTSCRVSLQGQNLLTFTRFKGGDPEQTLGYLPPLRRIILGVQFHL